jgi:uncharacterized protein
VEAKISSGWDFKNKDLHLIRFDRGGNGPYYTRPMEAGSPDKVDCVRLADEAATLDRVFALRDLLRLSDLLADGDGSVQASFKFAKVDSGRAGARVAVKAAPHLVCQRCMQVFTLPVTGGSDVEFAADAAADVSEERELYETQAGLVSLRELAEEELLLAMPLAPVCSTPESCGRAPAYAAGPEAREASQEMLRPFAALQDLLKKT